MMARLQIQEHKERRPLGGARVTRASASLPSDTYKALQDIAKQKRVSVSWVIRDAAEKYIAEQRLLFKDRQV